MAQNDIREIGFFPVAIMAVTVYWWIYREAGAGDGPVVDNLAVGCPGVILISDMIRPFPMPEQAC